MATDQRISWKGLSLTTESRDNGISFYVAGNYEPKSQQLRLPFTDPEDKTDHKAA